MTAWRVFQHPARHCNDVLLLNRAALQAFRLAPAKAAGTRLADLMPPEDFPRLMASLRNGLSGSPEIGNWNLRCQDGQLLSADLLCQRIQLAGRNETLIIVRSAAALPAESTAPRASA